MIKHYEVVYPGHPVVIAMFIMNRYSNLSKATEYNKEYPAALSDKYIPGAGGNVYQALELLKLIKNGVSVYEAFDDFSNYWKSSKAGGIDSAVDDGQNQAELLKSEFVDMVKGWCEK